MITKPFLRALVICLSSVSVAQVTSNPAVTIATPKPLGSLVWSGDSYQLERIKCAFGTLPRGAADGTWKLDESRPLVFHSDSRLDVTLWSCVARLSPTAWLGLKGKLGPSMGSWVGQGRLTLITPTSAGTVDVVSRHAEGQISIRSAGEGLKVVLQLDNLGDQESSYIDPLLSRWCGMQSDLWERLRLGPPDVKQSMRLLRAWLANRDLPTREVPTPDRAATFSGDDRGGIVVSVSGMYYSQLMFFSSGINLLKGEEQLGEYVDRFAPTSGDQNAPFPSVTGRVVRNGEGRTVLETSLGNFKLLPDDILTLGLAQWLFYDEAPRPQSLNETLARSW